MMVPVGRLTLVRTFAKSELIRAMSFVAIPGLVGPMLGPIAGGLIVGYFHWRVIFFVNLPIGLIGLFLVYLHLPDYREKSNPLDVIGLILFGSGIALLSYVLEMFGEHTLGVGAIVGLLAISIALLAGYGLHAENIEFPLLNLSLFRIRTFRASVSGSFFTRLGLGGIPFILPLLYQVGMGFTPIQSGLLIMPQAIAAMSLKMTMPGYWPVRLSRRLDFEHRDSRSAHWAFLDYWSGDAGLVHRCDGVQLRVFQLAAIYGHEHAGVCRRNGEQASSASSIASTMQQMSISFGVAIASLLTALFIPDRFHTTAPEMIHGIHDAFYVVGGLTVLSTIVFRKLKSEDGASTSQHKVLEHAG